jgi:protein-disulfide isomerase/uncharacterized membrane protein
LPVLRAKARFACFQEVGLGSSASKRIVAALCLCVAGAVVSGLLLLQHHGETFAVSAVNEVCGNGQTSGCADVARSAWSSFAGWPVAAWGLLFYLALALALAVALLGSAELREALAGIAFAALALGLAVDLALLGVQALAIKAFCGLCILTYVLSGLALGALWPARRGAGAAGAALGRSDGRLALGAWLLGVLAIAGFVLAAEAALAARAENRQAHLLGAPVAASAPSATTARPAAPAATPAPAAPAGPSPAPAAAPVAPAATAPAVPQDARYWQQRAQQLQETLDDPRKLDAYFAQKAQHEYDTAQPVAIDLEDTPGRGPAAAPVKVVEFSDFMCPFCRNLAGALAQFVPQAGGRVVVYFKNYPLDQTCNAKLPGSTHPGACNLALGAICARRQGKFEAYHDKVFSTELHNPTTADVVRLAGEAGLNAQAVQGCLDDPKAKEALAVDIAEGNRLGVSATPTLFVNGKKLPRINDFIAVVDKEARKKGFAPLAAATQ